MFAYLNAPRRHTNFSIHTLAWVCGLTVAYAPFTPLNLQAEEAQTADITKIFRAGAATSNITPPLGASLNGGMRDRSAQHVHDELHARCLVLDDGTNRLAIVTVDSCMISREVFDDAKRRIRNEIGLAPERIVASATHAHSAPAACSVFQSDPDPNYLPFLARRIADGVRRATNNLEPAKIGWGVGQEPNQVFNRRWAMKPGTIGPDPFGHRTDQVRMNPPRASENLIEPAGPTDPDVTIISVQAKDGRPIALLGNYSLHYVGGTGGAHVSADYYGMFADRIQQLIGADRLDPPFVGLLTNGTSGDINNINFRIPGKSQTPYEQIHIVADAVAQVAYATYQNIEYHDWVPLDSRQTKISLGVRLPTADELETAKAIVAKAQGPVLRSMAEIYARETVLISEYPKTVELILQAHRIGNLAICAIPCEVFAEIGLQLKNQSPLATTFTIELANGYNGYLPTPEQHKLGGYETWRARSSYLEVGASQKIVNAIFPMLKSLKSP